MYSMDVACFLVILLLSAFVRKIVLALDTDSQPVQLDFILQPQTRHVDVFHFAHSMSMENGCGFCVSDQQRLHCKPKSHIMLWTNFASDASTAAAAALLLHCFCTASALLLHCFCTASGDDLLSTSATPALDDFLVSFFVSSPTRHF